MMNNKDKNMVFTEDQKAVLLRALGELHSANALLFEWVQADALSEDMSKTLPKLIEGYFCDIAKNLNYESHLLKEKEERHVEIRKANGKIRELKSKLGSNKPVDGLKEQLAYLSETVREWWRSDGFNHVSDEKFSPYGGYNARFCFMLDSRGSFSFSDTPVTDKRNSEQHIEQLRKMGFEFNDGAKDTFYKTHLIDTPKNRELLIKMLRERFPSIEVHEFKSISERQRQEVYFIRDFDATIYNLADITDGKPILNEEDVSDDKFRKIQR